MGDLSLPSKESELAFWRVDERVSRHARNRQDARGMRNQKSVIFVTESDGEAVAAVLCGRFEWGVVDQFFDQPRPTTNEERTVSETPKPD